MSKKYDEKSIQIFEGLEGVRKKPGMYVGSPDAAGMRQCVKEITDNAIDEALAGRNNFVGISFDGDTITVWDKGAGIPVGKHEKTNRSTLIEVFARLHAGGKMSAKDTAYSASTGTHGVGSACTNALSEFFNVTTFRDKNWWQVKFKKGKVLTEKPLKVKAPKLPNGKKAEKGTVVEFKLDTTCFNKGAVLKPKLIMQAFEIQAYLQPNVKFQFIDKSKGIKKLFYQPDGYKALMKKKAEQLSAELMGKPFIYASKNLNIVVQWSDYTEEAISSYVNGSPTIEHGTHVAGFFGALNEALKPYKGKRADFTPADLRAGLIGVVNYKMASPMFDSQTKEKLKSQGAEDDVKNQAIIGLTEYFKNNKTFARELCSRATEMKKSRAQFTANKKLAAQLTSKKHRSSLPKKLTTCLTKDPNKRELFLVEGDSAGGTSKVCRDPQFQEILPLRGKIINAYGPSADRAEASAEVISLLQGIGFSNKHKNPEKHLRVGKIMILADADDDGQHIALLVASLLYKILPPLFVDKKVYIVNTPLFMATYKDKQYVGMTRKEVLKKIPTDKKEGIHVTRFKGLGEISASSGVLQETAFNPKTRNVTRLADLSKSDRAKFVALAGERPADRKKLLFSTLRSGE